jgi:GNAT superfamily N-acetyltransferase
MTEQSETDILQLIRGCEVRFPREFALWRETGWGILYYAPYNPQSHDSNHAIILDPDADVEAALDEITAFYRELGISPRVYSSLRAGEWERLVPSLRRRGFQFMPDDAELLCMLHDGHTSDPPAAPGLEIRRVREVSDTLLRLIHSEERKEWTEGIIRRQVQNEDVHVLVGCAGDEAVTMALLCETDVLARVDEVQTAPAHRRKGYNLAVIRHLVRLHGELSAKPLYLFSDNPAAARNYQRCGFRILGEKWQGRSAFLPDESGDKTKSGAA